MGKSIFLKFKIIETTLGKGLKLSNRPQIVNELAFNAWSRFQSAVTQGYKGDYFTFLYEKDFFGKMIYRSCKEKTGVFYRQGIKLTALLNEAKRLNEDIQFKVRKKNQFKMTPDIADRLARIIAKRILLRYKKYGSPLTFYQHLVAHPLGKKITKSISNNNGQLKKAGISLPLLMKKVSLLDPELNLIVAQARINSGLKSWATRRNVQPKTQKIKKKAFKRPQFLGEEQQIKTDIKKIWPNYLELRKKMLIGTPFPEYVITHFPDLTQHPQFMRLLNESYDELRSSHGSKQSTESLQRLIKTFGNYIGQ